MIRSMTVYGVPQAKGSTRSFSRGGRIITTSTNRNLHDWSLLVASEAQRHVNGRTLLEGPLSVSVEFVMPKPKSKPKSAIYPVTKPDIDKLLRAVLDPLSKVWFLDDSQVAEVRMMKVYGDPPRVRISVTEMVAGAEPAAEQEWC